MPRSAPTPADPLAAWHALERRGAHEEAADLAPERLVALASDAPGPRAVRAHLGPGWAEIAALVAADLLDGTHLYAHEDARLALAWMLAHEPAPYALRQYLLGAGTNARRLVIAHAALRPTEVEELLVAEADRDVLADLVRHPQAPHAVRLQLLAALEQAVGAARQALAAQGPPLSPASLDHLVFLQARVVWPPPRPGARAREGGTLGEMPLLEALADTLRAHPALWCRLSRASGSVLLHAAVLPRSTPREPGAGWTPARQAGLVCLASDPALVGTEADQFWIALVESFGRPTHPTPGSRRCCPGRCAGSRPPNRTRGSSCCSPGS